MTISRATVWLGFVTAFIGCLPAIMACAADSAKSQVHPSFVGSKAGEERRVAGVKLCWCPAGRFTMGSPRSEPERRPGENQVEVTLTKGFWTGKYEVTQGDWKRIVGKLPGQLTGAGARATTFPSTTSTSPRRRDFCRKLTEKGHASGELPSGWEFRLPTEAQWEYACRAGTTTATAFGDKLSSKQANFQGQAVQRRRGGPVLEAGHQGRQLSAQRLGHCTTCTATSSSGAAIGFTRDFRAGVDPDLYLAKGTATRNRTGDVSRHAGAAPGPTTAGPRGRPSDSGSNPHAATTTSASASSPSDHSSVNSTVTWKRVRSVLDLFGCRVWSSILSRIAYLTRADTFGLWQLNPSLRVLLPSIRRRGTIRR